MKIGIPRALGYYNYYPFWHGFFKALGFEIILSDKTTKQMVNRGSSLVVTETCLPVKVYIGHLLNLLDKGVDVIYVPCIQSIEKKIYNCSKLRGLPDLIRNVVKANFLMVEPVLDKSEKNQGLYEYLYESVAPFGITDKKLIKEASKKGWEAMNNYHQMTRSGVDVETAIRQIIAGKPPLTGDNKKRYPVNVAVISHGYNIFDSHVSMKALKKLEKFQVRPYTAENLTKEQMLEGFKNLDTELYWANEYEMTGAAGYYMKDENIDGVITLTAFGCGPDSLMIERMTRFAKRFKKPLLNLTIDEHTGEAGFITRLEAFCDMLFRKKRVEVMKSINSQVYFEASTDNVNESN